MSALVYQANLDITGPIHVSGSARTRALRLRRTDVETLCKRAALRYRVSGGRSPLVAFQRGGGHQRTLTSDGRTLYVVDVTGLPQRDPERALRILEILAFGFNDYGARETVCGRGLFVYPLGPEHGRAWLAAIGRRGGQQRTPRKREASRQNLLRQLRLLVRETGLEPAQDCSR